MISTMDKAWDLLDIVHVAIQEVAKQSSPDDSTTLLFRSSAHLFRLKLESIRNTANHTRSILDRKDQTAPWDSAEERAHRFLSRSDENIVAICDVFENMVNQLVVPKFIKDCFGKTILAANEMAESVAIEDPLDPPSAWWECVDDPKTCIATDHFHARDRRQWPTNLSTLEKQFQLASRSDVTFRDFQLVVLPATNPGATNLLSAIAAAQESVRCTHSVSANFRSTYRYGKAADIQAILQKGQLLEALTHIGHETQRILRAKDDAYTLGIILPGGSEILWPEVREAGKGKSVIIKVREAMVDNPGSVDSGKNYKFDPVKEGRKFKGAQMNQTVNFVDLPAEVRNMIYNEILVKGGVSANKGRMPEKQPPISLTCRLVNKEIMSLLFHKYGWFVSL